MNSPFISIFNQKLSAFCTQFIFLISILQFVMNIANNKTRTNNI
jgi:hypothetical protein